MKVRINPYGFIGFGLASPFALTQEWSLPEFCWSTWLAGLVYAWACIFTALIEIILTARSEKSFYDGRLPFLQFLSLNAFLAVMIAFSVTTGFVAFQIYNYLFGFYGLFLSVFSEMAPLSLFGRNGFINSDFFTPVMYLVDCFWPMAAGVLATNWRDFFRKTPWKRMALPFHKEILRIHLMIIAMPFFSLMAWAIVKDAYQPVTILLLMGLFYLLPQKTPEDPSGIRMEAL
ncbi:MAG: hypothetical protein C4518_10530 [Desulfobacteraceae bacterium]|nr:MAG: hypothetical protein C4518_10530 [Desulfobacteraceae bacterium]